MLLLFWLSSPVFWGWCDFFIVLPLRDAVMVIQFAIRAFFSVRTWPWMILFFKLRPLLRSAQVEKELAALNEEFKKLKEAYGRSVNPPALESGLQLSCTQTDVWCPAMFLFVFFHQVGGEAEGGGGAAGGFGSGEKWPGSSASSSKT